MNKSLITNLLSLIITIAGYFLQINWLFIMGLFALSGAITNWLAIHMLFEKVPLLYGSGVVVNKFEEFKAVIKDLMMNEFLTKEKLKEFFEDEMESQEGLIDFDKVINDTDFSIAYESLKQSVLESKFGGMLSMFGGEKALEPLKEPFSKKLKSAIKHIVHTSHFQKQLKESIKSGNISDDIYVKIEKIVDKRLAELTPKMVKEMVQKVIREHLGWLVVWGGVFGGLIGVVSSFVV